MLPPSVTRTADSSVGSSRAMSDASAASSSSSVSQAAPLAPAPPPPARLIECWEWRGDGNATHLISGDQTRWADTHMQLQMDRGSIGVLTGSGYSLVARDSRAAYQFLYEQARLHPELEDEDDDDDASVSSEGGEGGEGSSAMADSNDVPGTVVAAAPPSQPAAPLSSALVQRVWAPSARLRAHFPPVLRLPFQLIGTWNSRNGEVNLTKRHGQGEVHYRGVSFLLRPSAATFKAAPPQRIPVPRFDMALQCEFAQADLSFTLAPSTEADDVPPPPPPPNEEMSEVEEPGAPPPPPPPLPQQQTRQQRV